MQLSHLEKKKKSLLSLFLLHLIPKEEFSHVSLVAREERDMFSVFVYLYLFHYLGGPACWDLLFLFSEFIELYFSAINAKLAVCCIFSFYFIQGVYRLRCCGRKKMLYV